jgi:hypothetical protein
MKMWIEAGHGVDLAERYVNLGSEVLQPIGGQVAELMLNGPEFFDQAPGSFWFRMMSRLRGILTSKVRLGNGELGP